MSNVRLIHMTSLLMGFRSSITYGSVSFGFDVLGSAGGDDSRTRAFFQVEICQGQTNTRTNGRHNVLHRIVRVYRRSRLTVTTPVNKVDGNP